MDLTVWLVLGVALLSVAGAIQLWRGRLTGDSPTRTELLWGASGVVTSSDGMGLRELFADRDRTANLLIVTCEVLVMTMSAFLLVYVAIATSVPAYVLALLGVTYLLGAYLLGRAMYLRLGLDAGTLGSTSSPRIEEALANSFGANTDDDFAAISGALDTARGDADDDVLAVVLAGARNGASPTELRDVCSETRVGSPEAVDERISALVEGGLLTEGDDDEPLAFTDERLTEVDPDQVASMATSLSA